MEDIAKEYTQKKESKVKHLLSNVSTTQVIIFGGLAFVAIMLSNNKNADPRLNYVIYAVFIIIILVLLFKPSKEKVLLPEHIVKRIAQEALDRKVRDGKEFGFDSKVEVSPYCHLQWENDMMTGNIRPIAWDIGYIEHVNNSQYKKEGVIRIHPFEGTIIGLSEYPLGYSGRETHDKDIVPVGVVQGNVKTTDFGNGQPTN
jgi:hypothetical protein